MPSEETPPAEGARDRSTVRETYDRIAAHFDETRSHPWPEVRSFVDDAPPGDRGLDLGCGNGRHAAVLADRTDRVVALDASRPLLETARERFRTDDSRGWDVSPDRVDLVQGDAARLPLSDATVDLAVYVATLHHLPTRETRLASLDELARVLAPEGRALVSAWSTEHDRFQRTAAFDTTIDWTLPGGETVARFYHIYDPDSFDRDLGDSDLVVARSFVSSGNCYAVVHGRRQVNPQR